MNVFFLLARQELRDQRALLVASCVLAPICSALIAWAFRDTATPENTRACKRSSRT